MSTWLRTVMNTTDKRRVQEELDGVIPYVDVNVEYKKVDIMGGAKELQQREEYIQYAQK